MAEESDADAAAAAAAAKKKKMMMGGGALLAAAAIYRFVLSGGAEPPPEALASADEAAEEVIAEGIILQIPEMTLNLAHNPDGSGQLHYARIGLAVVLREGVDPVIAETEMPLVQDVVVDVVTNMTFEELREPGVLQELKDQISELAREEFEGETVARIIFTSFVIQ